ncbi:MAG: XrtA system polysaccharide chain length determinant [Steroidobacteraceae bacterium]
MNRPSDVIFDYLRAVWRRRWLVMMVTWGACALAWIIVLLLPERFEATAKVFVDPQTALRPVLRGIAIDDDSDAQIGLVREALLSRPALEAVARKTDLDARVKTSSGMDQLIRDLRTRITVTATSTLGAAATKRDNLYSIAFSHEKRDMSVAVVRALLDSFVEGTLSGNRTGAAEAQSFLVVQIKDYEKRLADAEARLADFKKRNVGMIPGDRGDYFRRLDTEMTGLQKSETDLAIAVSRREELSRQLANAQPFVPGTSAANGGAGANANADISTRLQESEARLEELLLRFTDKHPEVIALRNTIAELKAREARELAELAHGGRGTGAIRSLNANPVYQTIQVQLNQAEVEIASLRGAVAQHRNEISGLRQFVNLAPEVEQEFARLNRDYGVTKAQYETMVQRLEQARMSDEAAQSGAVRFEVIEPPHADVVPAWPNRRLFITISLLAGIVAGLGAAITRHMLAPTFDSTQRLRAELGIPVLGSVSRIPRAQDDAMAAADRRRLVYSGAGLLGVFCVLLIVGNISARWLHNLVM